MKPIDKKALFRLPLDRFFEAAVMLAFGLSATPARANPSGGTVAQGKATFTTQGNQLTIRTSDRAVINWKSFNIGVGQTTTFVQPSSSSVAWNVINDSSPSQILGNLNANGYVVLQNQAGFYIGGQAVINAQGLVMTTSPTPPPDIATSSAWQFNAPPPSASIVNYGEINVNGKGSAFLIAANIENHGTITAPEGSIGLYAGKEVLVSERADGRGLSAKVTLPEGSVDNTGKLIADGGTIALRAQVVNQGGLVQANSIREVNGVIELVASGAVNLGASSTLSARGDSETASAGGSTTIKSGGAFSDQATSAIDISGGASGGKGGHVEISAVTLDSILSQISGGASSGYAGGSLLIDPENLTLTKAFVNALTPLSSGGLSTITLQAEDTITVATSWTLAASDSAALLTLTAGNNIVFNAGSYIKAGNNWNVSLSAGDTAQTTRPDSGTQSILLSSTSYIQTQNGNISLWAANDALIDPTLSTTSGIRTLNGGSISVTAKYGDINTGANTSGYLFGQNRKGTTTDPYYKVSQNLGGISTGAGGDVTLIAGNNITSYLPVSSDETSASHDAGSGAFGAKAGNVTVLAGGDISGHYVLANGAGNITAGGNIGAETQDGGFALSLIKGSWSVTAPKGNIYIQDIRNPNGVFNDAAGAADNLGYHLFDYAAAASVSLTAGNLVEITGAGAPHFSEDAQQSVPTLFPPSLTVTTGKGGFVLAEDVTLFPSALGELNIFTLNGGDFKSYVDPVTQEVTAYTLRMSDSSKKQWIGEEDTFSISDHAGTPPELNNANAVEVFVTGSMENVTLRTSKETHIQVGGDLFNASLVSQNLHASDETTVQVAGSISYSPIYTFVSLSGSITSVDPLNPSAWDSIFSFLVNPDKADALLVPSTIKITDPKALAAYVLGNESGYRANLSGSTTLKAGYDSTANPGFIYDATTKQLGYKYQMSEAVRKILAQNQITIFKRDAQGNMVLEQHADGKYYYATETVSFAGATAVNALQAKSSLAVKSADSTPQGFQIGGPGKLTLTANTMDLGSSGGIISWGSYSGYSTIDYSSLASLTTSGASVKVNVAGHLSLFTSTIASVNGGDVSVSSGGGIYLSQGNFSILPSGTAPAYGIWTSGNSDVSVVAQDEINIGGARIATFNGGDILVRSEHGSVNAGNGANSTLYVPVLAVDSTTGQSVSTVIQNPRPFGSGILAVAPGSTYQASGSSGQPGNITVQTPEGDILSTLGGIGQFVLNGTLSSEPTITLEAGTFAPDRSVIHAGNINLGNGGVVGGTLGLSAAGTISGLIVSRGDANVSASKRIIITLLSIGQANVNADSGPVIGIIVGVKGVSVTGGGGITASVQSQNASVGGAQAESTLGSSATASATGQAAAGQAGADARQQLAKDTSSDDEDPRKKKGKLPTLTKRVGRVTVILPKG
jgi:filamentous hemagglutinin family protein